MATNYTFDDFEKARRNAGVTLSKYDMDLARTNPGAGIGIVSAKQNYSKSTSPDSQSYWHAQAENIRKENGYSGGTSGSQYIPESNYGYLDWSPSNVKETPGSFNPGSYSFSRQGDYDDALDRVVNRQGWSYDPQQDQAYQAARKQYLREADRSTANTMGQYAAMTGGIPSSQAVSASQQAGDYHRAQLSDRLGEYIGQDYQRYIDSIGLDFDTLSALRSIDQDQRSRYENDRGFGYNQFTDDINYRVGQEDKERNWRAETALGRYTNRQGAERYADETAYNRSLDEREWNYQIEQDRKAENQQRLASLYDLYNAYMSRGETVQANAIMSEIAKLSAGDSYSAIEQAIADANAAKQNASRGTGSSGGAKKTSSSGSTKKEEYDHTRGENRDEYDARVRASYKKRRSS